MGAARFVLAAAALAACSSGGVEPLPVQDHDFVGLAVEVDLADDYAIRSATLSSGSPGGGELRVGPARLVLHDGRELTVPAGTPGGNTCEALYDAAAMDIGEDEEVDPWPAVGGIPESDGCPVIGETDAEGNVAWFQILGDRHDYDAEHGEVTLGSVVSTDGEVARVSDGYVFPLSPDLLLACHLDDAENLTEFIEISEGYDTAVVDVRSGELVKVRCISGH